MPGDTPDRETVLEPGELVTSVTLPPPAPRSKSTYLKLRDRASYEFALASAAVVVTINGHALERVRIAMGGIGTKPWRSARRRPRWKASRRRQKALPTPPRSC